MNIQHIDHIAISVSDVETSVKWYRDVLGLERRHEDAWKGYPAMVCAGDTCVALFPVESDSPEYIEGRKFLAMRHFAFRVDRENYNRSKLELPERGIQFREEDHGISHSIYFDDPDGHHLEITTYEV
jgi:catechol 2,3-dioxygenase-like lactoylglutathione lyase family enzyme